ncbi:MAG: anhydro-N-acetylmuramic acid kinase [Proteobacteria bacterium]|nr:anhydro-N-acetylmuramic acid kinase [Pseudomonadota bacterium]
MRALGLMSGTSLDGIDAALLVSDGERVVEFGPVLTSPYQPGFRERLRALLGRGRDEGVAAVEEELTRLHAWAVATLLARAGLGPAEVDVIGLHGHTILHEPARGRTIQIGDGALLARLARIDVVADFRSADVAAGGEGAPLAPVFHAALAEALERPLAVLNLGGVANLTWIGADGRLVAFDTGPGNALIDDWVRVRTGRAMDADGRLALAGRVEGSLLARLLADPYFGRRPPKSLDRDHFAAAVCEAMSGAGLSAADGAALLAAFTAEAVARGLAFLPSPPRRWLVAGGGRRNAALLAGLREALAAPVAPVEAVGWDGDALEAQCFAHLAVRALRGLPLSFPETTGAPRPMCGGRLYRAPGRGA